MIVLLLLTLKLADNLFMYGKIWPEMLSEESLQVNIVSSQDKYSIGERGLITVDIENTSDKRVDVGRVVLTLPSRFFDGFIIDYPIEPSPLSVTKDTQLLSNPGLSFGEAILQPGEAFSIRLPLIANVPGDYAGSFTLKVITYKTSEIDGKHQWEQMIPVIIVPPETGS